MVAMAEVKGVMPQAHLDHHGHRGHGDYRGEVADQPTQQRRAGRARARIVERRSSFGLLAEFETPDALLDGGRAGARRRATRAGTATRPFPVHGLDGAMGLRADQAALPGRLGAGLTGAAGGAPAAVVDERASTTRS